MSIEAKTVDQQDVLSFAKDMLFEYGSNVVEDRAVPDFRDGLKPSHRAILWSLHVLGLRPSGPYKKAARAVGDAIGRFRPHGDASSYGAMITMANTAPPAVDGQGNWGSPIDGAAAYRYTEAKLSKFSHMFMLNPEYLKVTPMIDNFSRDEKWPLYVPALLPFLLLNGNPPVPAYGVSSGNQAFTFRSVAKLVIMALDGKEVTAKLMARTLVPMHEFGCAVESTPKELLPIMDTGRGTLVHKPLIEHDQKARRIVLRSFNPGTLTSLSAVDKTLSKIAELEGVRRAFSQQGKRTKGSGPYGACFVIETQIIRDQGKWDALVERIEKIASSSVATRLGVTVRHADKPNSFHYLNFVRFFRSWLKYRVGLETDLLNYKLKEVEDKIYVNKVYEWAALNLTELLDAMKKVLLSDNPVQALMKRFRLKQRDAEIILQRRLIQLAKLELLDVQKLIAELEAEADALRRGLENPAKHAARTTEKMVKAYLKDPDLPRSGIPL